MVRLIIEKFPRVLKNKKRLEKRLNIKIESRGKEIQITGAPEDEYKAEKVITALDFGFPFSTALLIKEEDFIFESINIKEHTKRKDFARIKSRLIGTKGKALKTLSTLTGCYFEIKDNWIGVIGEPEHIKNAERAVILIIKGSKHGNVYSYLEKHQIKPVLDLGLKEDDERLEI
ncbi:hypothetical protein K0A97_00195 [Patescibacteria group bacterium]|nr:hypothetical protein [Patescibacteria group bacterium]